MITRSQANLFSILLIIVGVIGGYLYYTQFASQSVVLKTELIDRDDLEKFQNLKLDFSVLDSDLFEALQQIGEAPIDPGQTGKKDIFAPIQ